MAPLTTAATRTLARSACRATVTASRALSASAARPGADSSFQSPFKGESNADKVPDFSHYMSKGSGNRNLLFQYFMVGTMGAITAAGAKSTIHGESSFLGFQGGGSR